MNLFSFVKARVTFQKKKDFFLCQRLVTKTIVHDSCVLLLLQILLQKGVL